MTKIIGFDTFDVRFPTSRTLAGSDASGQKPFVAPKLTGQSIMLVAPQTIEASLIARRLQRWGGHTCMVSDIAVAEALLPERSWQAVLLDHAFGLAEIETLGEAEHVTGGNLALAFGDDPMLDADRA